MMNIMSGDVPSNLMMNDFELVEHYTKVLSELAASTAKLMHYRSDDVVEVSILGVACKMDGRQLSQHIRTQMNFFERMIEEAQERIVRSEGKVG